MPPLAAEEIESGKQNGDVEGRIPYGTTGGIPETSLYWQSDLPDRESGKLTEMEMWQVGNPIKQISTDRQNRGIEIRNAREPIIPNTMGGGFYGSNLAPIDNVTNSSKAFFATNDFSPNYSHIRDMSDGMTRHEDRVVPSSRAPSQEHDEQFARSSDPLRSTSNKLHDNASNNQPTRNDFITLQTLRPPTRDERMEYSRQIAELSPYSMENMMLPSAEAFNRSEIVSVGPPQVS
jgi:hypothetical protein